MRAYMHWPETEEFTLCGRPMNHVPHPLIAEQEEDVACNLCADELTPRAPVRNEPGLFAALKY